jgi:spermidine synthase
MSLELAGLRIVAPYLGTSLFVWTAVIGIVMAGLSLGYFLGGRLADRKPSYYIFSLIILASAILIFLTVHIKSSFLYWISKKFNDIKIKSLIASLVLFGPANFYLGMITPYAVRLRLKELHNSGAIVGRIYAISTMGSIIGTFGAGFLLIPYIGNDKTLIFTSLMLGIISLLIFFRYFRLSKIVLILLFFYLSHCLFIYEQFNDKSVLIETDSIHNHIKIYDTIDTESGRPVRVLQLGLQEASAIYLDNGDLVYNYMKYFRLAKYFKPDLKDSLMIGAGCYAFPQDYLRRFPEAFLDVVEIDAKLTELAQRYFGLKPNKRLRIYHEDGRVFLNRINKKYDVIFIDAFNSSATIPFQLTTLEAIKKMYQILKKEGVVFVNIYSAIEGKYGKFLQAEYRTFKSVFPDVYLFPVKDANNEYLIQNVILVAVKSNYKNKRDFRSTDFEINGYLNNFLKKEPSPTLPILTDGRAPVELYTMGFDI